MSAIFDLSGIVSASMSEQPAAVGMLSVATANDWSAAASVRPTPANLWRGLWYEGEVCLLFADSNIGKSILAVQIAEEIAGTQPVLYCDFEMTDKQFQMRYTSADGALHTFPAQLHRAEINMDGIELDDFEGKLLADIEQAAAATGAHVVIIDNITYICNNAQKADAAGHLMQAMQAMKRRASLSLLVLAHTPKRPLFEPLTQNSIAGSKQLANFADSIFSIGRAAADPESKFIKQIKCRNGAFEYGENNVILCHTEKPADRVQFAFDGYGEEGELLRQPSEFETATRNADVCSMLRAGESTRVVAARFGISQGRVCQIAKKAGLQC